MNLRLNNFSLRFFASPWLVWLVLLIAHCALMLYNRYPILYSDTATYLHSGFELEAPADRPIVYGLLLRLFSLNGSSLLFVPFFHTLIYLYSIYKFLSLFFEEQNCLKYLFLISLSILIFSGTGWCINLLLPDIFMGVGFLCLLYVLLSKQKPSQMLMPLFLFFISTSTHISNVFVFFALVLIAFLSWKWLFGFAEKKIFGQKLAILAGIILLSYLIMGSAISKSKHVFMVGNLAQKGILQEILQDSCSSSGFKLCDYKDSIPLSFEYFVWKQNSPLYKLGGWKTTKPEFKKIITISFSHSKYLGMHLKCSLKNLVQQLGTFGIGEGTGKFDESTPLIQRIRHYTSSDRELCVNTKQYDEDFKWTAGMNVFYKITISLAVILLTVLILLNFQKMNSKTRVLIIFTFLLITSSSVLVAFGSEVSNRYGCKIVWLILLLDAILLIETKSVKKAD
ncbi:MAG: hypothetical protein IT236_11400 [Bacteroidia bacterium]|nr:hypothetical protein [Bacteroidia bacterium]